MLLVSALLLIVVAAACGSNNDDANNNNAANNNNNDNTEQNDNAAANNDEDQEPITIEYWHAHGDTQIDELNRMLDVFHEKYPWITVDAVYQGGYGDLSQKLIAAHAAGDVPAVTNLESASIPNFADSGAIADITSFIEQSEEVDLDDFSDGMIAAYSYEGKNVGLPLIVSAAVNIYNADMVAEAGVEPPETWDEMFEFGEALTKDGTKAFGLPGWSAFYYDPYIYNGGGQVLIEENGEEKSGLDLPETKKFLNLFNDLVEAGYAEIYYGSGASGNMRQAFFDGELALVGHTSSLIDWYIENADFEVGVAFYPEDERRMTTIGGAGIIMMELASDEEKEAAWKFMEFMTSAEENIQWADGTGYLPTRQSAIDSPEGQEFLERKPQYSAVLEWFDNIEPRLQHPRYPEFRQTYEEAMGTLALEGGDPDELLDKAAQEMNDILND